jgi:hypothetical protein
LNLAETLLLSACSTTPVGEQVELERSVAHTSRTLQERARVPRLRTLVLAHVDLLISSRLMLHGDHAAQLNRRRASARESARGGRPKV